jgi:hypothetical protein
MTSARPERVVRGGDRDGRRCLLTTLKRHPLSRSRCPRAVDVARLACRHRVRSAAPVARFYGRAKATLNEHVMASRPRPSDRDIVQVPVERILSDLRDLAARSLVRHWSV